MPHERLTYKRVKLEESVVEDPASLIFEQAIGQLEANEITLVRVDRRVGAPGGTIKGLRSREH